ncbi:tripartite tricarboxylate transporter substrate binding protein [Delftia lacustris]|jgi:tripartite-type tricarboxylate transporter receptor subunit TctC|uniref:Bug family tripartite tricarboxylate transporter substrate binding protein n=1 Tax=Delftia lacustris TaxID=558537 RepID=UPI00193AF58E|nr:tripartite tricarboxylate transporter substrate binding protein [Delftia lacustris]QRI88569.1 tripartite tricarboxylate transporter substrate binding protein [Delftia lacustris]
MPAIQRNPAAQNRTQTQAQARPCSAPRRQLLLCALPALAAALLPLVAQAQPGNWPSRAVRMVVPYTPGGGTDAVARQISERVGTLNQWTVVVDNKPGAGGNIGLDAVAKSAPDGYTFGMGQTANLAINPALLPSMPFNPRTDLIPVALVAAQPTVLVVPQDSPWKSVQDLVKAAKADPGGIRQGLASTGTVGHLAGEMLAFKAGIQVLNVPYKGAAPAVTDLLGKQTHYMFGTPQAVYPLLKGGKLRALAVTSARRLPILPEVPTVAESGYAGFEAVDWKLIVAPKGTPAAIVQKMNIAVNAALQQPAVQQQLQAEGSTALGGSMQDAARYLLKEQTDWAALIRDARIRLE